MARRRGLGSGCPPLNGTVVKDHQQLNIIICTTATPRSPNLTLIEQWDGCNIDKASSLQLVDSREEDGMRQEKAQRTKVLLLALKNPETGRS